MARAPRTAAALLLCLCAFPSGASAQLSVIETEDLRLIYFDPTLSYMAPYAAQCFQNSMQFQTEVYGFEPAEKVTVLLKDFSDRGNASAGAVPRDFLQFDVAPIDFSFETVVAGERMYMLMNHELVHVTTMDQAAGSDRFFRSLFGGKVDPTSDHPETILYLYLTTPRMLSPRWYLEGIAVFSETWMAGGLGRAQGAYDEMVFRSMVRYDSHFYDPLGLLSEGTKIDFQVEVNAYIYGTRFMSYLAYTYSPQKLVEWVSRTKGSRKYYSAQFKQVFGQQLRDAWNDWIEWEKEFQTRNLEAIREYPVTPYRDLSTRALGSISRPVLDPDTRRLYAAFNYPGVVAHVGSISLDDGEVERLVDIKGPAIYSVSSLALDPRRKTIFYTTDHFAFRDLRTIDPETGKSRILIKDGRIGDLVFNRNDDSLWGVRHLNGIATLVRIPYPYEGWNQVRSWPYGEVLYDIDLSQDGTLLSASVGEISGRQKMRVWKTEDLVGSTLDDRVPAPIGELDLGPTVPQNFVFSPDGRYLYGSAYYTGVSNIFRYELATDEWQAVSNTDTGFFRPIPLEDNQLIVFRYTGEGFVPAVIEATPLEDINPITFLGQQVIEKHSELEDWRVGSPAEVPLESMITREGSYGGFKSIGFESIYPILEGYKESGAFGLRINFSDHLGINRINFGATYSLDEDLPSDERLHLRLEYERHNFRASGRLNYADFYDLFGPTKRSLKGYSLGLGYDKLLVYDRPREMEISFDSTFYGDLDQVPGYQNVETDVDELLWAQIRMRYEHIRSSLGHVDDEKGFQWELVAANNYVESEAIPTIRGAFDFGFQLPITHSSIWLRTAAGRAWGDLDNPFANFFFGAFGNNYVDHEDIKRYHHFYAFPGLDINEVGGQDFAKAIFEWNLPPIRFRRAGWPGFYLSWVRTSVFAGALVTDIGSKALEQELADVGAQMDFHFAVMSNLEMTLSLGYAQAFEDGFDTRDEYMFSLRILSD